MRAKRQRLAERPEIILEAADAVLRKGGARALTIDAVAAEAGLSKGGVLHHYASKDALILALVARKLTELREGIAACEGELPSGPSQLPIAMVAHVRSHYCDDDESSRALLLASIEYPEALNDYRAFVADQLDRLGGMNSACPGEGSMLFFAILGVIMGRTLGFHQLDLDELKPMFDALERIARKSDA
ncbi:MULTISPECIES: TetR/AcrR family transcriptional regulator [Methylobacterium]|jgi:AcrR family transcriptional regulator|uniref:TetR/AcrR family transcriptional regulator n=1 Tax=Methylobacterium TaxID=407 RepID=UPI0011CA750A|nr:MULTISPECIES: TetR/AcrR family transcriptional regulator [Methylobacterium]TXN43522.1 TetR/AcrR family transcriptional regulator [Methylobacterium sp. WL7]TXN71884.1 TetR/AcrR family transcriptional regulator [Methylobacterium sp. WL18]GJE23753.1 HTH-type transcriptional regulator BetI [Methylobacterium mesophilicum]